MTTTTTTTTNIDVDDNDNIFKGNSEFNESWEIKRGLSGSGNLARPLTITKEKSHVSLRDVLGIRSLVRTCQLLLEELDDVI